MMSLCLVLYQVTVVDFECKKALYKNYMSDDTELYKLVNDVIFLSHIQSTVV